MKYVIENARASLKKKHLGITRFMINIIDIFSREGIEPIIFEKPFLESNNPLWRRIAYFIWLNTIFLLKLFLLNDDVIVIGINYYIPFIKIPRVKYYPVIHDLIAIKHPELIPRWNAFVIKLITKNAIKHGDKIITVSETAKKDIADYFHYPEENIYIINNYFSLDNNINTDLEKEILQKYDIESKKFILSVSSFSPHKNIKLLIRSFNKLSQKYPDYKLVLVGQGYEQEECKRIAEENVIFTNFIEDDELKILYKNAYIYAFSSQLEGFGIPILDAQRFGVPVICSDIPVFHEVANDSAVYAKISEEGFTKGIELMLSNKQLQQELVDKGYENIKRFSIDNISKQLMEIIDE